MSIYHTPEEYNFRIHHCRPRFKSNVEAVLIYMASEINRIGSRDKDEFNEELLKSIRCFPGNATVTVKTMNNWRTEISSLFGLFYEDEYRKNHACLSANELAESNDLVRFFKRFCFTFQYPGAHVKAKYIKELIENKIRFKPVAYFLRVLSDAEKETGKKCYITKAEACYCIFNDLRCTRDNEPPINAWHRIQKNRELEREYVQEGDIIRYAGDILDYMELANLLTSYNGKHFYLNHRENETILRFVNSNEWFDEYDEYIERGTASLDEINNCKSNWFRYVNRELTDTDFSTDITNYICDALDSEKDNRNERMKQFAVYLEKINKFDNLNTKDIGDIGETLVEGHECERLRIGGREDLIHLVKKMPTELAVGYDISSRELDETIRNIEVKTTISNRPIVFNKIHLTPNEWQAATSYTNRYFVYRLMISKSNIKLFILNDPVKLFKDDLISIAPRDGMEITFKEKAGQYEELLAWNGN
ncbi:protein NO VEIN domain-containing protein [Selenomonas ruminantium]|uniref:Protein NO VEIN C-terminal domain-containing protein n=1 Tax=Selenomonas ruminantium TaxID=971 RepID=A0A1I0YD34_SELRU|nr:DUF3883 domain-containing protein [Selenomonas ruminantium]SFB10298.1 protein of unknown function [Selenomonas ruminantium]